MSKKLLLTKLNYAGTQRKVAALFEDDFVNEKKKEFRFSPNLSFLEFEFPEENQAYAVGNIYVGRIDKVAANVKACFISLKEGVNGFLGSVERDETWVTKRARTGAPCEGEEVLVQIVREASGTKLCGLTTELSLPGSGLVVTWGQRAVHVSGKLSAKEKNYYQKLGESFLEEGKIKGPVGILFRTNAVHFEEEDLFREFVMLSAQLSAIVQKGMMRNAGTCLYMEDSHLPEIFQRNLPVVSEIITDDPDFYARLSVTQLPGDPKPEVFFWNQPLQFLTKACGLQSAVAAALDAKVMLPSGGWLMIQQTEAFLTVDVNSGSFSGSGTSEETYRRINREAAREIARQLRLRNLGGLILIDFISMKSREEEDQLLALMNQELKKDSVAARAVDFTAMHICEVTRKKIRRSLGEQFRNEK